MLGFRSHTGILLPLVIIFLIFTLLVQTIQAVEDTKPTTTTTTTAGTIYYIRMDEGEREAVAEEVKQVGVELGINVSTIDADLMVIIVGESLDSSEKALLTYTKSISPEFFVGTLSTSQVSFDDVYNSTRLFIIAGKPFEQSTFEGVGKSEEAGKSRRMVDASKRLILLLGGPSQNKITSEFLEKGVLSGEYRETVRQMVVANCTTGDGAKVIVVSDKRGFSNLARKGSLYSPLAKVISLEWVPLVASFLGAFLVVVFSIVKSYIESKILARVKKGYKINKNALKIFRVKVRELFALIGAAFVLGVSLSWTFAGPTVNFIWLLLLNVILCLLAGLSHEMVHWIMGRILGVETEYRFWFSGSIATILSAVLGNSFGLQGFLVDEIGESVVRWKVGLMKLAPPIFSTFMMILAGLINFFSPHVVFQMTYSIAGIISMSDILPFRPMDGYDVRRWNILIWLASFLFISASFVIVNFIL